MPKNQEILEILEKCNGDENAAQVKEIIGLWVNIIAVIILMLEDTEK